jgi:phosphoglycolate phosphatase-like HAD superfamily hydrolase
MAARDDPSPILRLDSFKAMLVDIDGTLIDSNTAHADAWAQALTDHGLPSRSETIRPLVGMGSDKLLPRVAHVAADSSRGQAMGARKKAIFGKGLPHLHATAGARPLLEFLRNARKTVVVATSADEEETAALLRQAGVDDLIPQRSSKDDAESSKPDPDIVHAALERAGCDPRDAVMLGDTPYDIEAARRAGIRAIALRCGGHWTDADLGEADAIFDNPADLLRHWRESR